MDGLTFEARPGSILGFLGPNGAGKTTTLRIILGLAHPTSGGATIDGRPTAPSPIRPTASGRSWTPRDFTRAAGPGPPADHRPGRRDAGEPCGRGPAARGALLGGAHARARRTRWECASDSTWRRRSSATRDARARRARQRPRPPGDSVAPRLPALARRAGPHDPRVEPRARPRSPRPWTRSWSSIAGGFARTPPSPSSRVSGGGRRMSGPAARRPTGSPSCSGPRRDGRAGADQGSETRPLSRWVISPRAQRDHASRARRRRDHHRSRRSSWS